MKTDLPQRASPDAKKSFRSRLTSRAATLGLLRCICCVALSAWAVSNVDLHEVLASSSPRVLLSTAASVLLIVSTAWLQAARWQCIARALQAPLDGRTALRGTLLSFFLLAVTPSTMAADGARMVSVRARGADWTRSAQSVLLDRAFGLTAILLLALMSIPLVLREAPSLVQVIALPLALMALAALVGVTLLLQRVPYVWLTLRPIRIWDSAVRGVREALLQTNMLWSAAALSVAIVAVSLTAFWLIAAAVGARADIVTMLTVFPAALLATVLPISIGGWGVREASIVALYPHLGTAGPQAMAVSVAFGLATFGAGLLSLAVWIWISRCEARRSAERQASAPQHRY